MQPIGFVYRIYEPNGAPRYFGKSASYLLRKRLHEQRRRGTLRSCDTFVLTPYYAANVLHQAELDAIYAEQPQLNVLGKKQRGKFRRR